MVIIPCQNYLCSTESVHFLLRDFSNNSFEQASSIAILKTDKRIFSNVNQDKIQVSLQYYRHELMTFQYISIRSFYELLRNLKVLKLFLLHVTPRINLTKMPINSHLNPKNGINDRIRHSVF